MIAVLSIEIKIIRNQRGEITLEQIEARKHKLQRSVIKTCISREALYD